MTLEQVEELYYLLQLLTETSQLDERYKDAAELLQSYLLILTDRHLRKI